jgi:hypothetical protein
VRKSKSREVPELSATSICSGRNAGNVGLLFTCTSVDLVLLGVQRFMFFYGGELLLEVGLVHYLLAGSSSVLVADTLVKGPNRDG